MKTPTPQDLLKPFTAKEKTATPINYIMTQNSTRTHLATNRHTAAMIGTPNEHDEFITTNLDSAPVALTAAKNYLNFNIKDDPQAEQIEASHLLKLAEIALRQEANQQDKTHRLEFTEDGNISLDIGTLKLFNKYENLRSVIYNAGYMKTIADFFLKASEKLTVPVYIKNTGTNQATELEMHFNSTIYRAIIMPIRRNKPNENL